MPRPVHGVSQPSTAAAAIPQLHPPAMPACWVPSWFTELLSMRWCVGLSPPVRLLLAAAAAACLCACSVPKQAPVLVRATCNRSRAVTLRAGSLTASSNLLAAKQSKSQWSGNRSLGCSCKPPVHPLRRVELLAHSGPGPAFRQPSSQKTASLSVLMQLHMTQQS